MIEVPVISVGAGPPDCRHTTRAVSGLELFKAMMLSEKRPLPWRASTAPKVPQQSASCTPLHLTHMLMVPATAALRPPPPVTDTYVFTPLKARAPPATPFRSAVVPTAFMSEPLVPRVAVALPLKGQYET